MSDYESDENDWEEDTAPGGQLIVAARNNRLEEVIRLIDVMGVDLNYRGQTGGSHGCTPVSWASANGHPNVVRALLARGADPNIADNMGHTPAMCAFCYGHTEVVQLLIIHGADIKAVTNDGQTARSIAHSEEDNHSTLVTFLDTTDNWHPFRIAIGCRLHADLKIMLKTGKIDPAGCCPLPALMETATSTTMWVGQPPVCPATTRLARMAASKWSPSTHWLHHGKFREAVHTVLLVAGRLGNAAQPALPVLPIMVWREVLGELLRDW